MRRRWRVVLLSLAAVVVIVVGLGGVAYAHLNSNLHVAPLHGAGVAPLPAGVTARTDSAGHTPIDLLVIGSDTRASAADCRIGGDCNPATSTSTDATSASGNADVEMLVHISAERTRATVLSIPRDTVVTVPKCTDPTTGAVEQPHLDRINSTLAYGPSCTVAAVHQLTGVPIEHFLVIDFAGVVRMSDAIGGVRVCVDNNVYDPYSHLKLSRGAHTLKGIAALEFLRTRHGFGNGSDLGRTSAQHLFLAAMLRKMKSASTLTNPVKVYSLANAATGAITVDPGLGSVSDLVELAYQMSSVPTDHTTFITMPSVPNPANRNTVLAGPGAVAIFHALAADTPLPALSHAAKHTHAAKDTHPPASPTPAGEFTSRATASSATGCAQVSTLDTVSLHGVPMTPSQAYAESPKVAVSAP